MKKKIVQECPACGGTGLYSGMCEGPGKAVICVDCEGTGAYEFTYTEYTGRHTKRGIKEIRKSRGRTLFSCGGEEESMTYKEFKKAIPERKI